MNQDSVAVTLLIDAALKLHNRNRNDADDESEDFVAFSDDEIRSMIGALWYERYSTSRRDFIAQVGTAVLRVVKE